MVDMIAVQMSSVKIPLKKIKINVKYESRCSGIVSTFILSDLELAETTDEK